MAFTHLTNRIVRTQCKLRQSHTHGPPPSRVVCMCVHTRKRLKRVHVRFPAQHTNTRAHTHTRPSVSTVFSELHTSEHTRVIYRTCDFQPVRFLALSRSAANTDANPFGGKQTRASEREKKQAETRRIDGFFYGNFRRWSPGRVRAFRGLFGHHCLQIVYSIGSRFGT